MHKIQVPLSSIQADQHTAIVAGHYQVVWCPLREALVPVLRSEPLGHPELPAPPGFTSILRSREDFPERTFEMGVRLCGESGASLLVVVDDVYFKRSNRLPVPDGDTLAEARAELAARGLPKPWQEKVAGVSLVRDASRTPPADLFTEYRLNRRFSSVKSVTFGAGCDAEGCNCSETALQLLLEISQAGFRKAVLYLPLECSAKVEISIRRVVPQLFHEVTGVWGNLDGDTGELEFATWKFGT